MNKRTIGTQALFLSSVSAIIGSGWLFSAYYSAKLAGTGAIFAWFLGAALLLIIAFVFAEICSLIPISGSSARIPYISHGTSVSMIFSWIIWLSYLALMGSEIQAVLQYLTFYIPDLTQSDGALTAIGYVSAAALSLLISILNVYSIRLLMKANSFLTAIKITLPIFIVLVIFLHYFSWQKLTGTNTGGMLPTGWHGIFAAISAGGIVFAFNGFKQAAEMAGEAKNPHITVPLATIGSILVCLGIYLLLQLGFLTSLTSENLIHGWNNLALDGQNSPIAAILTQDKLSWLNSFLYAGAVIAPMAAAPMYCAGAARSLYAISKIGYAPKLFQALGAGGNPTFAIIFNFFLSLCVFAPLPGWESIATFLTSLLALTYALGPVCLLALRKQAPDLKRPFKLPIGKLWSVVAFYICTLLTYWSGWTIVWKTTVLLAAGYFIFLIYYAIFGRKKEGTLDFLASLWVWFYLVSMAIISYLGSFNGINFLSNTEIYISLIMISCVTLWLSTTYCLPGKRAQQSIEELNLPIHQAKVKKSRKLIKKTQGVAE
jgi:amino acid transporter